MCRETPAFAQQKWPGGTLYHYGLCEVGQRQAVFMRKDKTSGRAIKSDRAKVVMTAGCISRTFDIPNYIYIPREIGNLANQNFSKQKGMTEINIHHAIILKKMCQHNHQHTWNPKEACYQCLEKGNIYP